MVGTKAALHFLVFLSLAVPVQAAPRAVAARGAWAALTEGRTCEAASKSLRPPLKDRPQARASLSFDAGGPRHGQLAVQLSRMPRAGATVMLTIGKTPFLLMNKDDRAWSRGPGQEAAIIAAIRASSGMKVEARSPGGGRIRDYYSLDGAPLAIDAAAACAARLANR